ncbi:MAG TPA: M14 metallopeptidase family protein [Pyrinomonadaceae bacterium]|nr:M14 metallopeptidase family protein [Pyrinomonadaceae bacterium]
MHRRLSLTLAALLFIALSIQSDAILRRTTALAQTKTIPAPADVLGFTPGDDRKLASWAKVVEYFQKLAAKSDRVKFEEIGKTTMGAPFVYATISAPENLAQLDEYKNIQQQLADPRLLGSPTHLMSADRKAASLIKRGKTVIAITCGIHSTEVGSYLSSMLIAHRLASSNDPEIQEILRNTIILLVPSTNPDGVDIVNNWYQKTLGTPYEGTDPPELYHKYTGHDDNRDWYAFTQVETQLVVDKILNVWHPQIVHDIHQQGAFGSRLFLPPYMQPVEPNVPKQIVEGYTELGNYLAKEMRGAGFKGITTDSTYDAWSPARAYSHYHGGVRILQETASCRLATPITVKFEQMRPGEGYDPRKDAANFGPVWQGGEWHIRDITNTMTTVAFFLLKHAAQNREHWLQGFYEIEKEAVRPRNQGELQGFEIIGREGDPVVLRRILNRGGVQVDYGHPQSVALLRVREKLVPISMYVPMAQPYASFAKALLEVQHYPDLRDATGRPIPPYDVTAHSLPLLMGVEVKPIYSALRYKKVLVDEEPELDYSGKESRVAIYKSHVPSMDEGWTRWVLEQNGRTKPLGTGRSAPFSSLLDAEARNGKLSAMYDTIIIPDQPRAATLNGHRAGAMPPEYTGGLGAEGVKSLREFVEAGGTLVCLNRASDFAIEQFKLPVRDVVDGLPRTDFYVPGSILRIELDTSDPIAKGMPRESIAWAENSPVFEMIEWGLGPTVREGVAPTVRVIAWYPKDRDPLLSGWLLGGDRIKGKAALAEVGLGKGRIILFGFRPQYRGQSLATYPLFFNAIAQH